jgi:hypothetical protein
MHANRLNGDQGHYRYNYRIDTSSQETTRSDVNKWHEFMLTPPSFSIGYQVRKVVKLHLKAVYEEYNDSI